MSESQTPMVDAAEFAYCDDLTDLVVESSLARQLETELTATRARLAEVNEQCTELLDDLEQATVVHAQAESRLAELEGIAERLRRAVDVSLKAMETAYDRSFTGMLRGFMGGKIDEVKAIIAYKEGKK